MKVKSFTGAINMVQTENCYSGEKKKYKLQLHVEYYKV